MYGIAIWYGIYGAAIWYGIAIWYGTGMFAIPYCNANMVLQNVAHRCDLIVVRYHGHWHRVKVFSDSQCGVYPDMGQNGSY